MSKLNLFVFSIVTAISLLVIACADDYTQFVPFHLKGEVGPAGPAGAAGEDGKDGSDGEDGEDGAPGRDAVVEIIDPCGPSGPGEFDEIILVLSSGLYVSYFESQGKEFLTILKCDSSLIYRTTDAQRCYFQITDACEYEEIGV